MRFSSLIRQGLCYLGLFSSLLELSLFRERTLPSFHHFKTSLIPFYFMIGRVRSGRLSRWKGRKLGLGSLHLCLAPKLRFHDIQKTSSGLTLYPHSFWSGEISLHLAYFGKRQVTKITNEGFWRLRLIEHLKIVIGIKNLNYFFFFFFFVFFCEGVAASSVLH